MALTIINSTHSFIRFNETAPEPHCIWGDVDFCLPVFDQEDIYFQFVIQGDAGEIDSLCTQDASEIVVALVNECDGDVLLTFSEKPQRYRLSDTQVLYNWSHGLPNFSSVISVNSCFRIQITVTEVYGYSSANVFCSNCFERIAEECFTSVIEYGNDEDAFGFKYCYGGDIEGDPSAPRTDCDPTIVQFIGVPTLSIPYTAGLQSKYGVYPTVQAWVYDGSGQLVNMGITITFDTYPPTLINLDFGGVATGIVIIR